MARSAPPEAIPAILLSDMKREMKDRRLGDEVVSKRGLVVGVVAATLAVAVAVWSLLTLFEPSSAPRSPAQSEISRTPRTEVDSERPSVSRGVSPLDGFGPLSIPDGGWPETPRSLANMDVVEAGTLQRGSTGDVSEDDETPADEVHVPEFHIDRYETTNEDYARCVEAGVCQAPMELPSELFGSPRQPVVGVSWHDASTFCRWSGKRLPSEAEWERAARGNDRRTFPWGDESPTCERAVINECDRYGPAEVGGRPDGQGPFGTQDLSGNVWEWVQDWYVPRYFPVDREGSTEGPPAGGRRVLRGGSWHFGPEHVRAANRHRDEPSHRTPWYGFRCAYRQEPAPVPPTPPPQMRDAGVDTETPPPAPAKRRDADLSRASAMDVDADE